MSRVYMLTRVFDHEGSTLVGIYATRPLAERAKSKLPELPFLDSERYLIEEIDVAKSVDLEVSDGVRLPSNEQGVILAIHKDKAWVLYDDMTPGAGLSFATVALTSLEFAPESRMIGVQDR